MNDQISIRLDSPILNLFPKQGFCEIGPKSWNNYVFDNISTEPGLLRNCFKQIPLFILQNTNSK